MNCIIFVTDVVNDIILLPKSGCQWKQKLCRRKINKNVFSYICKIQYFLFGLTLKKCQINFKSTFERPSIDFEIKLSFKMIKNSTLMFSQCIISTFFT